jgi:16S rRNA (adenine1518-N6/adenine1519-N6)-dimethyltransferase
VLAAIAGLCQPRPGLVIVEIGAGSGNLTDFLIGAGSRVLAIERDRDLAALLRAKYRDRSDVTVVEADAKRIDPVALADHAPFVLCGNIPYHLSAPLLELALGCAATVERVVYLLQRELALRLAAPAGTRACGALSVLLQQRFDVTIARQVGAGAFVPAPRVDSALLVLQPQRPPRCPVDDEPRFRLVVHAGFAQRRKQLANPLRTVFDDAVAVCTAAGIDPRRRAETLSVAEWVALSRVG